jgi:hypothetical protein
MAPLMCQVCAAFQAALRQLPVAELNALLRYMCQCVPLPGAGMPGPPGAPEHVLTDDMASTSDGVRASTRA